MRKKNVLFVIIVVTIVFMMTGCFKKSVISTNAFKKEAMNLEYTITEVNDQSLNRSYIKEETIAAKDGYEIEFYVLMNKDEAQAMFSRLKEECNNVLGSNKYEATKNMVNYSTYELITDEYYIYIARVEDTLFYANVKEIYKDLVKKLVDKLDY